jgi:hypothetical protein
MYIYKMIEYKNNQFINNILIDLYEKQNKNHTNYCVKTQIKNNDEMFFNNLINDAKLNLNNFKRSLKKIYKNRSINRNSRNIFKKSTMNKNRSNRNKHKKKSSSIQKQKYKKRTKSSLKYKI